jgi:hypothetical protein
MINHFNLSLLAKISFSLSWKNLIGFVEFYIFGDKFYRDVSWIKLLSLAIDIVV